MRNKIIELLKAKFEGVSDSIIERLADKLAKNIADESGIQQAVEAVTIQQLLESYGDSRATEAQRTAVKNYERKHGLKDGQKVDGSEPANDATKQEPSAIPEWAQKLIESNKALKARLDAMDTERTAKTRLQRVEEIIATLPDALRKPYTRVDYASMSDDEYTKLLTDLPAEVAESERAVGVKNAVFGRPGATPAASGDSTKATDAELDEVMKNFPV